MPAGQISRLLQRIRAHDQAAIQELRVLIERLVARYAAGDKGNDVITELIEYIDHKCKWYVEPKVRNTVYAQDVMQEIRLKVFRSLKPGGYAPQEGKGFESYLKEITKNAVNDFFRDKKKRGEQSELEENPSSDNERMDYELLVSLKRLSPDEARIDYELLVSHIKKAIQELGEMCQKILMLSLFMDWSNDDVGKSLDIPVEQFYWRKSRCLKELRKNLPPEIRFA